MKWCIAINKTQHLVAYDGEKVFIVFIIIYLAWSQLAAALHIVLIASPNCLSFNIFFAKARSCYLILVNLCLVPF